MQITKHILTLILAIACCILALAAPPRSSKGLPATSAESIEYSLILHIGVLREIDRSNTEGARSMLAEECMANILGFLELSRFDVAAPSLLTNSGLRAAARYWSGKDLPIRDDTLKGDVRTLLGNVRRQAANGTTK